MTTERAGLEEELRNELARPTETSQGNFLRSSKKYWEDFWRAPGLKEGAYGDEYPPQVRQFVLETLREAFGSGAGRVIVDVGAGRDLYLAGLLHEALPDAEVHALDTLDNARKVEGIHYRNASADATGFDPAILDAVVSTFTVDYLGGRRDASIQEFQRILKAEGLGVLVLHHPDSLVVGRERANLDFSFARRRALRKLRAQVEAGRQPLSSSGVNFPNEFWVKIASHPDKAIPLIEDCLQAIEDHLVVLGALLGDLFPDADAVQRYFESHGFQATVRVLHHQGRPVGYGVVLRGSVRDAPGTSSTAGPGAGVEEAGGSGAQWAETMRQVAEVVAVAEAADRKTPHEGHVVILAAEVLQEVPQLLAILRHVRDANLGTRVFVFDPDSRVTLGALGRGGIRYTTSLEQLVPEIETFAGATEVSVTVLGGSKDLAPSIQRRMIERDFPGDPETIVTWAPEASIFRFWVGLGFDHTRAKQLAAGMKEYQALGVGT